MIKIINTYNERKAGTTKVFFAVENNDVTSIIVGNQAVATEQGFQFYVDDHVAEQIEKCELYLDGFTPKLRVREGEIIFTPELSEKDRRMQELKFEMEQLENQ